MIREEYIARMLTGYSLVRVLSEKNGCRVLQLRHKQQQKDLVLRSFEQPVGAYECLRRFACENLPLIYDVIAVDDGQIVLEEYIEGLTVTQVMESGRYRYDGAKKVMQGVLNGLYWLHQQNLVHRDVKPDNVIITKEGRVVLIDLNASRKMSNASRDTVIMGTVGYASPEQLGLSQSDFRTDLYAAGVLLNVMITGKHPSQKMAKGKVGRIVRKCTEVNPDRRYDSAKQLAAAL